MAKIGFRGEALAGACLGGENALLLPAWNPNLIFTGNWDQQASNATTKAAAVREMSHPGSQLLKKMPCNGFRGRVFSCIEPLPAAI
jgi:hypothetical protein